MLDLAEVLWAEGRLSRARPLEEAVVTGRRSLYGAAHPDTLRALGKLAMPIDLACWAIARVAEARELGLLAHTSPQPKNYTDAISLLQDLAASSRNRPKRR